MKVKGNIDGFNKYIHSRQNAASRVACDHHLYNVTTQVYRQSKLSAYIRKH